MGKEILYCHRCGKRLISDDFTRGRAHTIEGRPYCQGCLPQRLEGPEEPARVVTPRRPVATPVTPRPRGSRGLVLGFAAGAALLMLGVLALSRSPSPAPAPDVAPSARAVQAAREFGRNHPSDPAGQAASWERAVAACAGAPELEEAKAELAKAVERRDQAVARELVDLSARLLPLTEAEQFQAAVALIQEAGKRLAGPAAKTGLDGLTKEVERRSEERCGAMGAQAAAARRRGAEEEVRSLRGRLEKWGTPEQLARFDKTVAEAGAPDTRAIFNGKDLEGWRVNSGTWRVEDGVVVGVNPEEKKNSFLHTERSYKDYEFCAKLRSEARTYIELHVNYSSVVVPMTLDPGTWYEMKVVQRGDAVEVWLDGEKPKVVRKGKQAEGYIGFFVIPKHVLRIKDLRLRKF